MPCITVHYGPPGPDRNQKLFAGCLDLYAPGQITFLYVVATPLRKRQLEELFLQRFRHVFEVPILTFRELVGELVRSQEPYRQVVDEGEKRRILEAILGESSWRMTKNLQGLVGLLPFVSQYVSFVKQQALADEKLLRLQYQKFQQETGPLEEELIALFSRYQRRLEELRCEDQDGLYSFVYESLLTGGLELNRLFPALRRLVFEGFHSFSPVERGIVQVMASEAEEILFSLDLDSPERKVDRFSEACRELIEFLDAFGAQWIFHPGDKAHAQLYFLQPETREDEVLEAALRIQRLKTEYRNLRWDEVAIICSGPDDYKAYLHEIFREMGIPFEWLPGRAAAESKAAATLVHYVRLLEKNFHRDELFDLLYSPYLHVPGLNRSQVQLMERLSIRAGIVEGWQEWTQAFPAWIGDCVKELESSDQGPFVARAEWIEGTAAAFHSVLESLRPEALHENRSCLEWLRLLTSRLEPFVKVEPAPGLSMLRRSRSENLSLGVLLERLKRCAASWSEPDLSLAGFADVFKQEISRITLDPPLDRSAVVVGDKSAFPQCRFRFLFWWGFAEGEFPDHPPQHIFFGDTRSSRWGWRNWRRNLAENYYLFHGLKACGAERVYYSCSKWKAEGPLLPSPFLRYLGSDVSFSAPLLTSPPGAPTVIEEDGSRVGSEVPSRVEDRQENVRRGISVQRLRDSAELSSFEGVFSSPAILTLFRRRFFADAIELSPSRLEDYIQCGFRYFTRQILGVEPLEELEEEITPLEKGGLMHRVLYRFMGEGFSPPPSETDASSRRRWEEQQRSRMAQIVGQELAGIPFEDLFWKHQEKRLTQGLGGEGRGLLARFIEREWERSQRYSVHALEAQLGPVRLDQGSDADTPPVFVKGTIDRIDRQGERFFLVDYKTGLADYRKRVLQGWGFQLPLYILAAAETLGGEIEGAGFYYIRLPLEVELKEIELENRGVWDALVGYYREKALAVAVQLYNGQFPVTLLGESNAGCRSCGFRQICRIDPAKMQQLKLWGRFLADETIVDKGKWIG